MRWEAVLQTLDWRRVLLCGLVTGFVWTLLSLTLLVLVGGEFLAALPGSRLRAAGGGLHMFLFFSNLAAGIWALWLYAAIRPGYGPGPKTAVIVGLAWWVIISLQSGKWVALVSMPATPVLAPLAATLLAIILAVMIGAWFYERRPGMQ